MHLPAWKVGHWESTHPRPGAQPNGYGPGYLHFDYPRVAGDGGPGLDFGLVIKPGGWTRISVTVDDVWEIARSPQEKVPPGVRELVVRRGKQPAHRITRPAQVARVIHWFDSLQVEQSFTGECGPGYPSPLVTFDFLGADGTKLATASYSFNDLWGRCTAVTFRVGNREERQLAGSPVLLRIERLLR